MSSGIYRHRVDRVPANDKQPVCMYDEEGHDHPCIWEETMSHLDGAGAPIIPTPPDLATRPTQERLEHHERHTVAELRTGDAFRRDVLQQMYETCKRQVEDARKNHPGKPMSAMMVQISVEQWVEIPSDYPTNPGETP